MRPSLFLAESVVVVSQPGDGVRLFDLDGRPLTDAPIGGTSLEGVRRPAGVALDGDKRLWVCDPRSHAIHAFTAFGRRVAQLVDREPGEDRAKDAPGVLGRPWAIDVRGDTDELDLLVGSRGRRRHALQVFDEGGRLVRSLRPAGASHGTFVGIEGVAFDGRFVYAVESGGRVSVYRDLEHHFGFRVTLPSGADPRLRAVAPAGGGRIAVLSESAGVLVYDAGGAVVARPVATGEIEGGAGELEAPVDLVVERGRPDARRRVVVMDRDGARVQVFSLVGAAFGAFAVD